MAHLNQIHISQLQAVRPSLKKFPVHLLKQHKLRRTSWRAVASTETKTETHSSSGITKLTQTTSFDPFKNWLDGSQMLEDKKLIAKLRLLQVTISDRKEMHAIIGQQRDNWNHLFQGSLRLATISAAILAAFSGAMSAGGNTMTLSLSAGVLDIVAALLMLAVNTFQPSQLAEEQRTAVRQFSNLQEEVEATLAISPALREDSSSFIQDSLSKLHSLDQAYPLPLTPGGLPKFPSEIRPSPSGTSYDQAAPIVHVDDEVIVNGWSPEIEKDLLRVSKLVQNDIATYLNMCGIILTANKVFAIGAPAMAFAAGLSNIGTCQPVAAALLSIGAFFAGSLSHDMQLGMVFEMYRNCAGYYADVDATIQRTLRMPVELRQDGELFHQKIVHRLGRKVEFPSVPHGAKLAGVIF